MPGGFLSELKQPRRLVALGDNAKIVGKDDIVGPAGSHITLPERGVFVPPPPAPPRAPGAPGAPRAPGPPSAPGSAAMTPNLSGPGGRLRKEMPFMANIQMKQVNWETISPDKLDHTIWAANDVDEMEWAQKLKEKGIFSQMEDEFKAKQIVKAAATKKKKEYVSVLEPKAQERIGMSNGNPRNSYEY